MGLFHRRSAIHARACAESKTPVVITVVCGTILTPILLKLSFRGHQETELVQNNIADRMAKHRQLDIITQQLLQQDEQLMKKN